MDKLIAFCGIMGIGLLGLIVGVTIGEDYEWA
jgi:hypothetical protein